jgi:uncharacterized membrane protein YphA (DoxX/SURF4 family)
MSLPGEIIQGILARSALVILRVYLGFVFLLASIPKIRRGPHPEFVGFFEQVALERGQPFYQEFVERVLLANAPIWAVVLAWGELLAGAMLIVGLLTRFSAALTLLVAVNYMLAKGAWFWTPGSNDAAFVVISLALIIGAAGRTLGFDALLARRWPRSAFW